MRRFSPLDQAKVIFIYKLETHRIFLAYVAFWGVALSLYLFESNVMLRMDLIIDHRLKENKKLRIKTKTVSKQEVKEARKIESS